MLFQLTHCKAENEKYLKCQDLIQQFNLSSLVACCCSFNTSFTNLHQPRLTIYQRFVPSPELMLLTQSLLLSKSLFSSLSTIQSTVKCCLLVKCISASFQSKIFFFCQVYIHLVDHILMPSSSTQFRHDKLFTKAWGWIYTFYNFYTAKC